MKIHALLFLCCLMALHAIGQDDEKNIVIQQARETYRFVRGNSTHPVQVKQERHITYHCNNYRTTLPVVAFYNDQVRVDAIEARVDGDKVKRLAVRHDYYNADGIFYSDARVAYFTLPLEKKGSTSEVRLEKTVLDPRYFTNVFFTEPHPVERKEVRIVVPRWMKAEIKEFNFEGYRITKDVSRQGDDEVYTYVLQNARALRSEPNAPGPTHTAPHVLVMSHYGEPAGSRITYFHTLADQYGWYRSLVRQIGNETAPVKAQAEEITRGLSGEVEKVKAVFQWVQDHIRYIAFEDGIAGFKPERAQEVLRKKYGDCKGMANLMAEMLKALGLDARLVWLGTNHIAYDYSTPSLSVDNHMICAWLHEGQTYFLDATEKYIGFGEVAERIQGRQALVENGEQYLLQTIPVASQLQNTAYEKRSLRLSGTDLMGRVVQTWKGENKEWLLSSLMDIKQERQEDALRRYLSGGNANYQISNLKIINLDNYNEDLKIEYDLTFKDAAVAFDKELYLDVDNRKDYAQLRLETDKRRLPYQFPFKNHVVFETEVQLPAGARVGALPKDLDIERPGYRMQGRWQANGNTVTYRRELHLKQTTLDVGQFAEWNSDITRLNEYYNHQLTVTI